jgi:hypothetical protein
MTIRCTWRARAATKTGSGGEVVPYPEAKRPPRCKRYTKRPSGLCEYHEGKAAEMPKGPDNPNPFRRP